ncbi:hypothetical protein LCGC14_2548820, partial [marine sediment metagenome]
ATMFADLNKKIVVYTKDNKLEKDERMATHTLVSTTAFITMMYGENALHVAIEIAQMISTRQLIDNPNDHMKVFKKDLDKVSALKEQSDYIG